MLSSTAIKSIDALAKHIANRRWTRDADEDDIRQTGLLALLEASDKGKSYETAQNEISRAMFRAGSPINTADRNTRSKEAIEYAEPPTAGDNRDLYERIVFAPEANEFVSLVPQDVGGRIRLAQRCTDEIEKIRKRQGAGISRIECGHWKARISGGGVRVDIGNFDTVDEARNAQVSAWRGIRERCYPLDPKFAGTSMLAKRKHSFAFWRALAREDGAETALPAFMYWDPLEALIFLEFLSGNLERVLDSAYMIHSRDHQAMSQRSRAKRLAKTAAVTA